MKEKKTVVGNQKKKETKNLDTSKLASSIIANPITHLSKPTSTELKPKKLTKQKTTRLTIKYDAGFHNHLHIRGEGANLSWEKGIPLKNVGHDEWIWETTSPFTKCEFKILINDHHYEQGNNQTIVSGCHLQHHPKF
jgi:hypothetical protein